jgi:hypothetical protein
MPRVPETIVCASAAGRASVLRENACRIETWLPDDRFRCRVSGSVMKATQSSREPRAVAGYG